MLCFSKLTDLCRSFTLQNGVSHSSRLFAQPSADSLAVLAILVSVFELGSIVCATAPNSKALIVGRVVSGIGAAGVTSGALILISQLVPLELRPAYTGE